MPTGRVTFAGGVSGPSIPVPRLPGPPQGVRGATISETPGGGNAANPAPVEYLDYGMRSPAFYAAQGVTEPLKATAAFPSNQGQRLLGIQEGAYMPPGANHNPSRSQISEGYTDALQVFASSNTWQLAGPVDSPGTRAKQPNQKFVSPFSSLPIPVKMPWDL